MIKRIHMNDIDIYNMEDKEFHFPINCLRMADRKLNPREI